MAARFVPVVEECPCWRLPGALTAAGQQCAKAALRGQRGCGGENADGRPGSGARLALVMAAGTFTVTATVTSRASAPFSRPVSLTAQP